MGNSCLSSVVAFLLLTCLDTFGAQYFVSKSGNNANSGLSGSPWLTINKATSVAVGGDSVTVSNGTYNEFVVLPKSGTPVNPITFTAVDTNTIIDPSTDISGGWVTAPEVGAGVYKRTGLPLVVRYLSINNSNVASVYTNGDITAQIINVFAGSGLTMGTQCLAVASSQTYLRDGVQCSFWDPLGALYCVDGTTCYLRLRDGSSPNTLTIRAAARNDNHTTFQPSFTTSAVALSGRSNIVFQGFQIRNAFAAFYVLNSSSLTIQSNLIVGTFYRQYMEGVGSSNNVFTGNICPGLFYGNPGGAWEGSTSTAAENIHGTYVWGKYMMGESSTFDNPLKFFECGNSNVVSYNVIASGLGANGISVAGDITRPMYGTKVYRNSISQQSSVGYLDSFGNTYSQVFSNAFSDCDISIRAHELNTVGETTRTNFFFRNTSYLPTGLGDHLFMFAESSGGTYKPSISVYFNSFSGGNFAAQFNAYTEVSGCCGHMLFFNNIFSGANAYFDGPVGFSTDANAVGGYDYNLVTPPSAGSTAWFGAHNIKTNDVWVNALGMSFDLPAGSPAIDSALDVSGTFTLNGQTYSGFPDGVAKVGTGWDMGALETPNAYFVMTNGNDAANGRTPATAWKTLTKAVSSAGTTNVYVGQGTYTTSPLHLTTAGQTFIASNGVFIANPRFEATGITLTNFNVGYGFFGGFVSDPVCWFKPGSEGSQLLGGSITSAAKKNQYGIIFDGNWGLASGVEITNFGVSGICFMNSGISNVMQYSFIHDNPSFEAMTYLWGSYLTMHDCVVSNNNDVGLPGSHPDLFQSFFAPSLGHTITNNLFINNDCQFGSLQPVDGPDGGPYAANAGEWLFVNNLFINQGSKMDVDFYGMRFVNNTFYNCNNDTSEPHVFGFNWSIYGCGTNGQVINNLFAICGNDPTSTNAGWFGIDEGTNTSHLIRNSTISSNNYVVGSGFAAKNASLLLGPNWVNGGNPKFLTAPSARIHKFNLSGVTGANQTTNIFGTNTSFTTELAVGDHITLGPYWTNTVGQVVAIINATNLWVDTPIGTGFSTKFGGPQAIQRVQGYDSLPDLRLLLGSLAIDAGANLSYNPFDRVGVPRPTGGTHYTIGAYEGPTPEVVPANMLLHITYNNWGGGTNALDSTTNHYDASLFRTISWWATPGIGPDGGPGVHVDTGQYMGITNAPKLRNLTNGTVAVWAQRTNGVGNGYAYILDCGFTFPCTNGWTLGNDNGQPTHLYVTAPDTSRQTRLTWPDFQETNYHHYAVTWSNASAIAYYDGAPIQTNQLPSPVLSLDDADWLTIGAIQHNTAPGGPTMPNAAFLLGNMADIRMYDTALSAAEILNVYYVSANPRPPVPTNNIPHGLPPQMLMQLNFANWNGSSNVLDTTANHSDGIATANTNGPTLVTGPYGTNAAGHFNTNQWLAVTNVDTFEVLTNGTVSVWINYDNVVGSGDYFAVDGWYAFPDTNCFWLAAPNASPTQFRSWRNSGSNTNMVYSDWAINNAWHMYTVTWDGSNVVRYFDAVAGDTNAQPFTYYHVEQTTKWLALGVQHGSHQKTSPIFGWLNGSLADIRIYNYNLSQSNIQSLFTFGGSTPPPPDPDPVITVQPANVTVTVPASATFTVTASGTAPVFYQWKKNGVNIAGATSSLYNTPPTTTADNGAQFVAHITSAGVPGTADTTPATLTVNPLPSTSIARVTTLRVGYTKTGP